MPNENQQQILYHLGYEWWMFRSAYYLLNQITPDVDPVRNALTESLAIHGRGLAFFFFNKKKPAYEATDWNAEDLGISVDPAAEPQQLKNWKDDASQRVAHLTATRKNPILEWHTSEVSSILAAKIEEVRRRLGHDFPSEWIGDNPPTSQLLSATGPEGPQTDSPRTPTTGPTGPSAPPQSSADLPPRAASPAPSP